MLRFWISPRFSPDSLAGGSGVAIASLIYGVAMGLCAPAVAADQVDLEYHCQALESRRVALGKAQQGDQLFLASAEYVKACRSIRTNPELAIAMAEQASVLRSGKKSSQALTMAQDCIKFEYLAIGCHIEKALSLAETGMRNEALQVLKTSGEVLTRLRTTGQAEIASSESGSFKIKPSEQTMQWRRGVTHVRLADDGLIYLQQAMRYLGVAP